MKLLRITLLCNFFVILVGFSAAAQEPGKQIVFDTEQIQIEGDLKGFTHNLTSKDTENGLQIVTLTITSPEPEVPPSFTLKWDFPSVDIYQFWNTNLSVDKITYSYNRIESRASSQAPVIAFMNNADKNRFTFACSEALNLINMRSYVREEDARVYCSMQFFDERMPAITEYTVKIRIDTRDIPYYRALSDVSDWWAKQDNYSPAPVPEQAKEPMYSTWYSFHQNLDVGDVINECRIAKSIGFEAVIVDDGWQTLDDQRGYAYTGDWLPERIPDMKGFVQSIHDLDMNFILWYSLPFIGENAQNYERFKGKYLRYWHGQGAYVLDPRYPDVREFIINIYETALDEWNLDGFKLDFLGFFAATDSTVMTAEDGRDFASVNESVDRLMTDIMVRLRAKKPDIMIEFRQRYIGPLMRKYGNMFRAADCPNMAAVNRARTTDIRLLCGNTAVHSDMYMWHSEEPVESAALQILNILFTVPQLSVRLDKIPEDHLKMAAFWTQYWKENRNILLDGEFKPNSPRAIYPVITAKLGKKQITALYEDMVVEINDKDLNELDIVNAKFGSSVILDFTGSYGKINVKIFDCSGNKISESSANIQKGLRKFIVPASGLLQISR